MENSVIEKLRNILETLECSEPLMKHYPEPVERHQNAVKDVRQMIHDFSVEQDATSRNVDYCGE